MKHSAVSIQGHSVNLDAYFVNPERQFFAVLDGTTAGGEFSLLFVEYLLKFLEEKVGSLPTKISEAEAFYTQLIEEADVSVTQKVDDEYGGRISIPHMGIGSTIVLVHCLQNHWVIANCGDSQAFLVRGGEAQELSRSHNEINEWVDKGLIPVVDGELQFEEVEMENGGKKGKKVGPFIVPEEDIPLILTRSFKRMVRWIGHSAKASVHIEPKETDDIAVLCSDGAAAHFVWHKGMDDMVKVATAVARGEKKHLMDIPGWEPTDDATAIIIYEG